MVSDVDGLKLKSIELYLINSNGGLVEESSQLSDSQSAHQVSDRAVSKTRFL